MSTRKCSSKNQTVEPWAMLWILKNVKNCNQISTLDMNMLIKRRLKIASS